MLTINIRYIMCILCCCNIEGKTESTENLLEEIIAKHPKYEEGDGHRIQKVYTLCRINPMGCQTV